MQLSLKNKGALALALALASCMTSGISTGSVMAQTSRTTRVEVWCIGDDILTRELRDAIEKAFTLSSDFQLSDGKKPGTLLVQIPTNVEWKVVGKRTKILYRVEFEAVNGRRVGGNKGSCFEDAIGKCAERIVRSARTVLASDKKGISMISSRQGKAEISIGSWAPEAFHKK